ncbi:MAG: hypothetical protein LBF92_03685, partial [Synergistaceae bacterium]|jgi:hypothetical protein|nr:hypothetical protein [Synergistaceae bacterium]
MVINAHQKMMIMLFICALRQDLKEYLIRARSVKLTLDIFNVCCCQQQGRPSAGQRPRRVDLATLPLLLCAALAMPTEHHVLSQ